jgi:hypothetical protein
MKVISYERQTAAEALLNLNLAEAEARAYKAEAKLQNYEETQGVNKRRRSMAKLAQSRRSWRWSHSHERWMWTAVRQNAQASLKDIKNNVRNIYSTEAVYNIYGSICSIKSCVIKLILYFMIYCNNGMTMDFGI